MCAHVRVGWGSRDARTAATPEGATAVRAGGAGASTSGRDGLVLDGEVAGAVRVHRDAGAHRRGQRRLLHVPALGGRRLEPQHLLERGGVVLDELLLAERGLA